MCMLYCSLVYFCIRFAIWDTAMDANLSEIDGDQSLSCVSCIKAGHLTFTDK